MIGTFSTSVESSPSGSFGGGFTSFNEFVFDSAPVKEAPYSAEAINENIMVLADGNRIFISNTTKIFRDSEGRTRRESTAGNSPAGVSIVLSGGSGANSNPVLSSSQPQIQISDLATGISYALNPQTHTAQNSD
jgi:hypothetical protein